MSIAAIIIAAEVIRHPERYPRGPRGQARVPLWPLVAVLVVLVALGKLGWMTAVALGWTA